MSWGMRHFTVIAVLVFLAWQGRGEDASLAAANTRRELPITRKYLNLPVKNGAAKRWVRLSVAGRAIQDFEMELAEGTPDWWAFVEVSAYAGKAMTIEVDGVAADSPALRAIELADAIKGGEDMYREALRPQFHFISRRGWNNDPNGLVYYRGEYHLFYQHNPYGWNWGNMHWGHAVSRDLVHWRELGDVLYPDEQGTMFSGSAVVDERNTSGFGGEGQAAMVCFYTAAGDTSRQSVKVPFTQCLAYSTDGRAFTKYAGNPVLKNLTPGNRDPKVIWHEPTQRWIMVLYVESNKVHTIQFFRSADLKRWEYLSQVEGFFECPDFFELPVAGGRKWVLTAASSEYLVGTFDGRRFQPETGKLTGHRGKGFYAAQTFSDLPRGRRVQIGWLQAPAPGMSFNQGMTVPLDLELKGTPEGPRLAWQPVPELERLRGRAHRLGALSIKPGDANPAAGIQAELVELRAEFQPGDTGEITFNVRGAQVVYHAGARELSVNGHRVPAPLREGKQRLIVLADRTALEVFASDGLTYVPFPFIPKAENRTIEVTVTQGAVKFDPLDVFELKSAWENAENRN